MVVHSQNGRESQISQKDSLLLLLLSRVLLLQPTGDGDGDDGADLLVVSKMEAEGGIFF